MKDSYPYSNTIQIPDVDLFELYRSFSDEHLHDIWNSSLINADYHLMKAHLCETILFERDYDGRNIRTDDDEPECS